MFLRTPEIVWHGKEPVFSLDFQQSGEIWRLASSGADHSIKVKGESRHRNYKPPTHSFSPFFSRYGRWREEEKTVLIFISCPVWIDTPRPWMSFVSRQTGRTLPPGATVSVMWLVTWSFPPNIRLYGHDMAIEWERRGRGRGLFGIHRRR